VIEGLMLRPERSPEESRETLRLPSRAWFCLGGKGESI
jgi:hypothetical protein